MKTRNTILLLIVAAAVIAAVYYQKQKEAQTMTAAAIPEQTIPAVTSGTLERIVIDPPDDDKITITRSAGKWYTNVEQKYEADENAVEAAIKALAEPVDATVVSTNPKSFDEYEVTDTSGTRVQFFEKSDKDPALELHVGKSGPSAFSTYVRVGDSENVLNAKANLAMTFKRKDGWRRRQIFKFSGANAIEVDEKGTSSTFSAIKTGAKWKFQAPRDGEAESAKISSLANMLANLRADDFVNPTKKQTLADFGLLPAEQIVSLTYEDKTTSPSKSTSVTLLIGKESHTDGQWYAKRADKNDIFTIGSYVADALTPNPDKIKVEPPPPAEKKTTATVATKPEANVTSGIAAVMAPKREPAAVAKKETETTTPVTRPVTPAAKPATPAAKPPAPAAKDKATTGTK